MCGRVTRAGCTKDLRARLNDEERKDSEHTQGLWERPEPWATR